MTPTHPMLKEVFVCNQRTLVIRNCLGFLLYGERLLRIQ